jgi:predicted nucleic acid-binding protein
VFSGLYNPAGVPGQVLRHGIEGKCELLLTAAILDEIVRNIVRKKPELSAGFTRLVSEGAFVVVPEASARSVTHWHELGLAEDAHVIAAAAAADADYICTGDTGIHAKLPSLTSSPKPVTPRQLLELLTL